MTTRIGSLYVFRAVLMDRGAFPEGTIVRVCRSGMRHQAPRPWCYVEDGRRGLSLVLRASLVPLADTIGKGSARMVGRIVRHGADTGAGWQGSVDDADNWRCEVLDPSVGAVR